MRFTAAAWDLFAGGGGGSADTRRSAVARTGRGLSERLTPVRAAGSSLPFIVPTAVVTAGTQLLKPGSVGQFVYRGLLSGDHPQLAARCGEVT